MKTIRWGIIGCGSVTEVKSGPAFQKAGHSALVAVMRRDAAKARDYAQRHGVPKWYGDAQMLVDDAEVDAVYVATPPSTHKLHALMAIAAGKPVYVEKPFAMDAAECAAIIDAARIANVPVFVAYYRRMLPRFHKVRELLFGERAVGAPRALHVVYAKPHQTRYDNPGDSHWHVRPEISGGGLFMDIGCHTLDILDWLFGPIADVSGRAGNQRGVYSAEDTVAMSFAFGNGMLGTGLWSFDSHAPRDCIEVIGDAGRLSFATFGDGPIRLENAAGMREFHVGNPPHIQQPLIDTIVAELGGQSGACPSTAESAARTSRVMDAVLRDYRRMTGQTTGCYLRRDRVCGAKIRAAGFPANVFRAGCESPPAVGPQGQARERFRSRERSADPVECRSRRSAAGHRCRKVRIKRRRFGAVQAPASCLGAFSPFVTRRTFMSIACGIAASFREAR